MLRQWFELLPSNTCFSNAFFDAKHTQHQFNFHIFFWLCKQCNKAAVSACAVQNHGVETKTRHCTVVGKELRSITGVPLCSVEPCNRCFTHQYLTLLLCLPGCSLLSQAYKNSKDPQQASSSPFSTLSVWVLSFRPRLGPDPKQALVVREGTSTDLGGPGSPKTTSMVAMTKKWTLILTGLTNSVKTQPSSAPSIYPDSTAHIHTSIQAPKSYVSIH